MALASGRWEGVQTFNLRAAHLDAIRRGVFLDAGDPQGAGNRSDVVALREQIEGQVPLEEIVESWAEDVGAFEDTRAPFLIY